MHRPAPHPLRALVARTAFACLAIALLVPPAASGPGARTGGRLAHAGKRVGKPRAKSPSAPSAPADSGALALYLSPGAPYGDPRARTFLAPTCDDTLARDTLYLSFTPARSESTFLGFSGEVYVYAGPGDTLGTFWDMQRGGLNNGGMIAQFVPDASFPEPQGLTTATFGGATYDRTSRSGRFRFFCAAKITEAHAIQAGRRYVLGRIVLGSRRKGLTGCDRPVCLEWHSADFAYHTGAPDRSTPNGSRWVPWGAPATPCRDRLPAYRPPGFGTPPGAGPNR